MRSAVLGLLLLSIAIRAFAQEPAPANVAHEREGLAATERLGEQWRLLASDAVRNPPGSPAVASASPTNLGGARRADGPFSYGSAPSHVIPALEIIGFDTLLNLYDRAHYGCCDFHSNLRSIRRNLRGPWVTDSDPFMVNQIGHPYQGSMYHGFARASGLGYWESLGYTFAGSALWEIAGETTPPSRNDQISTGIGGSFLGEALFRIANLWLEQEHGPPLLREAVAAAISPPTGFNRLAFGNRFRGIFPSHDPEYYSRLQLGVASAAQNRPGTSTGVDRHEGIVDYTLEYGLPGKPGYTYKRPFDYFSLQASASTAVGFDSVLTRGMLLGTDYATDRVRGIWGLYGSYDFLAPQVFRFASTALSVGTTAEWRITPSVALRGTGLIGAGYSTVSTINGATDETANHYGVTPQTSLVLRLIFGERASIDLIGREYYVSRLTGGSRSAGRDNIVRGDAAFVWRVSGPHAIAIKYQISRRDILLNEIGERFQTRGTVGIYYTLLGRDRLAN